MARKDSAGVFAPPPVIYGAGLLLGFILHALYPVRFLPEGPARVAAGVSLIAPGVFLGLWAAALMVRAGTTVEPHGTTTRIIATGPFAFSRNPIYIGLSLGYVGVAVAFNALWPLLLLPAVWLVMVKGVIEREEAYLERKFGEVYVDYKRNVRRWL